MLLFGAETWLFTPLTGKVLGRGGGVPIPDGVVTDRGYFTAEAVRKMGLHLCIGDKRQGGV